MKTHKDLDSYKLSVDFVTEIYKITSHFPKEEMFGLVSQMRRSAVSIPSNIAEGSARNHQKEYVQFLYIALSSAAELDTQLLIAFKLTYIDEGKYLNAVESLNLICRMIQGLIKYLKNSNNKNSVIVANQ